MIRVTLQGRLGNALFQYAIGRSLSLQHDVPLLLIDYDGLGQQLKTYFELDLQFLKPCSIWKNDLVIKVWYKLFQQDCFYSFYSNGLKLVGADVYLEAGDAFNQYVSNVHRLSKNSLLSGYFQHADYFQSIENIIRQDFSFKPFEARFIMEDDLVIDSTNAVAIHVRRADYITNSHFNICNLDYYQQAVNVMTQKLSQPVFYIFSDDLAWCKQHMQGITTHKHHFVDVPLSQQHPINDLRLMSYCQHNILSNSSFSWWGAWLNNNPDKIVIAPSAWYRNTDGSIVDAKLPKDWLTLDTL